MAEVRIHPSWKQLLESEFASEYWQDLTQFVRQEYAASTVYPKGAYIFRAFDVCPLSQLKVVIIGQDPYHGPNQANGLCFSVNSGVAIPPSLKNIYKEIQNDLGIIPKQDGDLLRWGAQGVLLLNSVLTVKAGSPGSHANKGWETFTDAVIARVNSSRKNIVYILWGKYAQKKGEIVNKTNNLVLASAHPSPYSASLFFNNHHFSQCNLYLKSHKLTPIDWS